MAVELKGQEDWWWKSFCNSFSGTLNQLNFIVNSGGLRPVRQPMRPSDGQLSTPPE